MLIIMIQKNEKKREVRGELKVVVTECSEKLGKSLLSDSESSL